MFLSTSVALLVAFPFVFGEVCSGFYKVNEGCDITYGNVLETLSDVATVTGCTKQCNVNANCLSVKYDPVNNICQLNSERFLALNTGCGVTFKYAVLKTSSCRKQINEDCSSTSECPVTNSWCSTGICTCQEGYSYKYTDNTCNTECDVYGSTYTAHLFHGLHGYNDKTISNVNTPEECMQLCTDEIMFVCRSVDYSIAAEYCWLSVATAFTAPDDFLSYSNANHYHRNCQSPSK